MTMVQQFRELPDPCGRFDELFRAALKTLLDDLASAPWYVREREVVNLFVFGHLVREFQNADLDIRQISIEMPVLKLPRDSDTNLLPQSMKPREARGKYADIVVWPHMMGTRWLTCKPLVHIEWKNISCREENPGNLERGHSKDIRALKHNQSLVCMSYAVLTDQRDRRVNIRCTRIVEEREEDFFAAEPLGRAATCPVEAFTDLLHTYDEVLSRPQRSACPDCAAHPISAKMIVLPS
jgi:hypothetical protein